MTDFWMLPKSANTNADSDANAFPDSEETNGVDVSTATDVDGISDKSMKTTIATVFLMSMKVLATVTGESLAY